jgi:hypothetical protein
MTIVIQQVQENPATMERVRVNEMRDFAITL